MYGEKMIEVEPLPEEISIEDHRVPPRDQIVTRDILDRLALEIPDKVFVKFDDGGEWTYAEFKELVVQTSLGFQKQGIGMGDRVLVWLPNGPEHIRIFFALNYIGAVYVPINTAFRGHLLEHAILLSSARLAVVHASLCDRLDGIKLGELKAFVICEGRATAPLRAETYEEALLPSEGVVVAPPRRIEPWDPMAIIFTSGTTGPSKAVLASYLHLYSNGGPESWPFVTGDDRYLINAPMFHIGGMAPMFVMLARGGSIALVLRFDTKTYWDSVNRTGATVAFLLGVMSKFLVKRPLQSQDQNNSLKKVLIVPLTDEMLTFKERFGVDIYTIFNMTEVSSPIVSEANPSARGTCGKVRTGVDVRLVDGNDCEVPIGAVGEMIVRTDRPWAMSSGYFQNYEATAKAWRNGWFHTGDAFRRDEEGNYFFVDRTKDSIRRRGENISSLELEVEVLAHPLVIEAAAIGVPSKYGEDDVMICVACVDQKDIDPVELTEFLRPRLPYYMLPKYIRCMRELPKTPSLKVMKQSLRKDGVTIDTWDRDVAGISTYAERL